MRIILALLFIFTTPLMAIAGPGQIIVSGEGSVSVMPDMAEVTIGVVREARRADVALDDLAGAVAAVFERLDAAGVARTDRQTAALNLQPRWDSGTNGSNPRIVAYVATNQVAVKVRDLDVLGQILAATIGDGANALSGLRFSVADRAPMEAEARRLAVQSAIAKAELYAEAAGVSLGDLMSISEPGTAVPGPGPVMAEMALRSADVPVAEGQIEIRAAVSMIYAIAD